MKFQSRWRFLIFGLFPLLSYAPARVTANPTFAATFSAPSRLQSSFHGSCYAFRGAEWAIAVRASSLMSPWWTLLQKDYLGTYPDVARAPFDQVLAAFGDLAQFRVQLGDNNSQVGIEWDQITIESRYGILDTSQPGPYNWAVAKVDGAVFGLFFASENDQLRPGSGVVAYHAAQRDLSNAWQALKQLPCASHPFTPAPSATQEPAPRPPLALNGDCTVYRSREWSIALRVSQSMTSWWNILQRAYHESYPVTSAPPVRQFRDAFFALHPFLSSLEGKDVPGVLAFDSMSLDNQYGVSAMRSGPYSDASGYLFSAIDSLANAAIKEQQQPGSGLKDYHDAQGSLRQTWPKLKALPCGRQSPAAPRAPIGTSSHLVIRVSVSPSTMPYDFHPTLFATTSPGALCSPTVVYSTGRQPVSLARSTQLVGATGTVSWTWHEETKGSSGLATVRCSYHGQTATASASFTVTG